MIINNVELQDIDLYDYEVAKKYEDTIKILDNISKSWAGGKKNAESIKDFCEAIFQIFDNLFGAGTSEAVFNGKLNLLVCTEALFELVEQLEKQKKEVEKLQNKYSNIRIKEGKRNNEYAYRCPANRSKNRR